MKRLKRQSYNLELSTAHQSISKHVSARYRTHQCFNHTIRLISTRDVSDVKIQISADADVYEDVLLILRMWMQEIVQMFRGC